MTSRSTSRLLSSPQRITILLICLATAARLLYLFASLDPLSGSDAPTYQAAGQDMADRGFLDEEITGVPYWPAGYPTFIGLVYTVAGDAPRTVGAVQILILAIGTYFAFTLARRVFGDRVAILTTLLICLSPALMSASGQLMYETTLGAMMVIGADLVSRSIAGEHPLMFAASGGGIIGLGATLQPKALAFGLLVIVWLLFTSRRFRVTALCALALLVGPLALATRTAIVSERFALSANLGQTMIIGFNDKASGGYKTDLQLEDDCKGVEGDLFQTDRNLISCSLNWALDNPSRTLQLAAKKTLYFWGPLRGVYAKGWGTWFHAFDPPRILPTSLRSSETVEGLDKVVSIMWMCLTSALILAGAFWGLRDRRTRSVTLLLVAPIVTFWGVSLFTIGDARFRIPVAPFYTMLIAVALTELWELRSQRSGAIGA